MFGRGKNPPVDDDTLRAQMLTTPSAWTCDQVTAQVIITARRSKKVRLQTIVVLIINGRSASFACRELADLVTGAGRIAESPKVDGRLWFVALSSAAQPSSQAEEVMVGMEPDQVAILAERDGPGLDKLATISTTQLSELVSWAQNATDLEYDARVAAPDLQG